VPLDAGTDLVLLLQIFNPSIILNAVIENVSPHASLQKRHLSIKEEKTFAEGIEKALYGNLINDATVRAETMTTRVSHIDVY
jgi:hypothetical protein